MTEVNKLETKVGLMKIMRILGDFFIGSVRDIILFLFRPVKTIKELRSKVNLRYALQILLFTVSIEAILDVITSIRDFYIVKPVEITTLLFLILMNLFVIGFIFLLIVTSFGARVFAILISSYLLKLKVEIEELCGLLILPFMGVSLLGLVEIYFVMFFNFLNRIEYIPIFLLLGIILRLVYSFIILNELTNSKIRSFLAALSLMIIEIPIAFGILIFYKLP